MISVTPNGRRAEEFAALIDGRSGVDAGRHDELLEVVGALRSVPAPEARPEYVADLRSRLMIEAEVALGEVERKLTLPASQPGRRDRRISIAAGAIALVGVTSSVAVASQSALPGDTLYPIKRAIEGASTTLTFDEGDKAGRILDNASSRLSEAESLTQRGGKGEAQLAATIESFTSQSEEGADLLLDDYATTGNQEAIARLHSFTADSMDTLSSLSDKLPAAALEPLADAVNALARINDLASKLCPTCAAPELELPALLQRLAAASTPSTYVVPESPLVVPTVDDEGEADDPTTPVAPDDASTEPAPPSQTPEPDKKTDAPKPAKDEKPKGPLGTLSDALAGEGAPLGKDGLVDDLLSTLLGDGLLD